MKKYLISTLIWISTILTSFSQQYKYPGQLEIKGYKIGDKMDTVIFKKYGNLYFPNYLDGWNYVNCDQLPDKYKGLPIAIWQLKSDSAIAVTLLNDIILNITISYLAKAEKDSIIHVIKKKFGADGKEKLYKQTHPLQAWITYWDLITWENSDVIFQIGSSDMRMSTDPVPTNIKWNLTYSDFKLENKIISEYKNRQK